MIKELDTPLYHKTLEKQKKGIPIPEDSPFSKFLKRYAPVIPLCPMAVLLSACGAGEARETVVSPSLQPEATSTPTLIIPQETETLVPPTPTVETKLTPSPEAIIFPQTELTAELLKQGFYGIGGAEEVDLGAMATPEAEKKTPVSWQTIEGYTSLSWDQEISLSDLSQDELKATKALISLGAQAGVEGFYKPGEVLPQFKDLTLLRLTINSLPNNQDFYDAKLNSSPQNLIIRKGTHLTVLGLWADASGRWATVSIDEGFDREKKGIQPRDVPRQFLVVIPQDLPEEVEGLSLSRLLNANDYIYHQGVVEHLGDDGKLYHQELNTIEPFLAKNLEGRAGVLFMDQKEDGSWYENPIVGYPPGEIKSTHIVSQGETLSTIAENYGLTVEEILKANPEIKDPSKINLGQEINIRIPGFTIYYGPTLTEDGRVVILSPYQTQELAQAKYNPQTKEWVWERIVTVEPTPTIAPTKEPAKEITPEPTPTEEIGVLYEKDFKHLRNEYGEWQFGRIYMEYENEHQTAFWLTGVILSEPEKRQVNALNNNSNVIHTYEAWFVKIGYTDPQNEQGKLIEGEILVWPEGIPFTGWVVFPKNGFVTESDLGGSPPLINDRDTYLSLFKFGKPVIAQMVTSGPPGRTEEVLKQFNINEPFPGTTDRAKRIYFAGALLESGYEVRLDLPAMPTFEEIKTWKEKGQLPPTNFLGALNKLSISE